MLKIILRLWSILAKYITQKLQIPKKRKRSIVFFSIPFNLKDEQRKKALAACAKDQNNVIV